MKKLFIFLSIVTFSMLFFLSCDEKNKAKSQPYIPEDVIGQLYLINNNPRENGLVVMERLHDGGLKESENSPILTKGKGATILGNFFYKNAIKLHEDYLFVTNAGGHQGFGQNGSISVFKVDRKKFEDPIQVDQVPNNSETNFDSDGYRPISIDAITLNNITWVVVANQYEYPTVYGRVVPSSKRNIRFFTFDKTKGLLDHFDHEYMLDEINQISSGNYGSPVQASFSPDGKFVAVLMSGVPDYDFENEEELVRTIPAKLLVYKFNPNDRKLITPIPEVIATKQIETLSGASSFSWTSDSKRILVTHSNVGGEGKDYALSLYDITNTQIRLNAGSKSPSIKDALSFCFLSEDNKAAYVSSYENNYILVYDISSGGGITLKSRHKRKLARTPDTKDLFLSNDGFLYVLGAIHTHTVSTFKVTADKNIIHLSHSPSPVYSGRFIPEEDQSFLGLTGF